MISRVELRIRLKISGVIVRLGFGKNDVNSSNERNTCAKSKITIAIRRSLVIAFQDEDDFPTGGFL